MPRFGTLHSSDWQNRVPEVNGYGTEPLVLPGARVLNLASEIAAVEADPLVPAAMNPSIPPYVLCTIGDYPQSPFGPFRIAEIRIVARAAYRPRAFVLRSFVDNPQAAHELSHRWGYPAASAKIEMRERHDRVESTVNTDGGAIFHGEMSHREIVAGVDLQFISSMHLVRNRNDGKMVLMQVDPELAVTRAERGETKIMTIDQDAWHAGGCLLLSNPMTATLAYADVTLPRIRFICDPERPAYEGTVKVAASQGKQPQ
jgi:hypothetical protein